EAAVGMIGRTEDAYTRRLGEGGDKQNEGLLGPSPRARASLAVDKGIVPHLALGGELHTLTGDAYRRHIGNSNDRFVFDAYGLTWYGRLATTPLGRGVKVALYGQIGGGIVLGVTKLETST